MVLPLAVRHFLLILIMLQPLPMMATKCAALADFELHIVLNCGHVVSIGNKLSRYDQPRATACVGLRKGQPSTL